MDERHALWREHLASAFNTDERGKGRTKESRETGSTRLSRTAIRNEATSLWHVASLGLRIACLVSSFATTQAHVLALQRAICGVMQARRLKGHYQDDIAIVVHKESEQIFAVNLTLFLDAYEKPWRRHYLAIDRQIASESDHHEVETTAPDYLQKMLIALRQCVRGYSHDASMCNAMSINVPIIVLTARDWTPSAGIALAGWLLEYDLVYYSDHESATTGDVMARITDCAPDFTQEVELAQDRGTTVAHRLSGCPLTVVTVILKIKCGAPLSETVLYQYTLPEDVISVVAGSDNGSRHSLSERINTRLGRRTRQLPSAFLDIDVTFARRVVERVAM